MATMKRDVNMGLLLLIVAALLMFSGFTVYYQTTFKNLSITYKNELHSLQKVTEELESKRSALNETSVQLQLKKQKEEDLSKQFTDVRADRDQLESDKDKLTVDLASTKGQLSAALTELNSVKTQLADKIKLVADLDRQVCNLKADVDKLENRVDDLKKKNDCLKQTAGASESC